MSLLPNALETLLHLAPFYLLVKSKVYKLEINPVRKGK